MFIFFQINAVHCNLIHVGSGILLSSFCIGAEIFWHVNINILVLPAFFVKYSWSFTRLVPRPIPGKKKLIKVIGEVKATTLLNDNISYIDIPANYDKRSKRKIEREIICVCWKV